jgi:hypothetical protein
MKRFAYGPDSAEWLSLWTTIQVGNHTLKMVPILDCGDSPVTAQKEKIQRRLGLYNAYLDASLSDDDAVHNRTARLVGRSVGPHNASPQCRQDPLDEWPHFFPGNIILCGLDSLLPRMPIRQKTS